ncbi:MULTISPECIES: shikimate dehydrogenase [Rheinheimera]|uniref:Shikimate dehydrogenase (NADP(+)) n=1 Tax=Rheinheimera marina TaxID=1774958 RepID=A0ABV9JQI4_9GAMM
MDRYAVFGHPIAHSKSPLIHSWFAEQTGQSLSYEAILAPQDGFAESWAEFVRTGGRGGNVTVPFKEQAFALAGQLSARAKQAGAVNTLYIDSAGVLCGDNTDGLGLVADLQRLAAPLINASVLVLGAGGAARGVVGPLLDSGVSKVHIANRTASKAEQIAALFQHHVSASGYGNIPHEPWHLVINATSSGLSAERPPLDEAHLAATQLAYDMLYGKEPTAFLAWCAEHQIVCADGLGMLVGQAAEAFAIWRGVKPQVEPVLKRLRQELGL